ncbi:MAG: hypothetical protein IKV40_02355 [Clostridia bacterium]|nr:hypothetical protein [Clostridia bacterium]
MFTEWNEATGTLRLSFAEDVFEFTVGSAFYTLNGKRIYLGYEIHETDGIPMIPLNIVVEQIGYKIDYSEFNNVFVTK